MEFTKEVPVFPVLDLDFDWKEYENGLLPIYVSKYIYNYSETSFDKNYKQHIIIDSEYNIFKIIDCKEVSLFRKYVFQKYALSYEKQEGKYDLQKIKKYLTDNIKLLMNKENQELYESIITEINKAKSLYDISVGEKFNYLCV